MRIPDLEPSLLRKACDGDLAALDAVVVAIQPGVFNLAVRILGNREDARDASQEILLKVVTRLGGFRGEAAFSTWVYRVAHNHLLTASTRARETREASLEELQERLAAGLEFGRTSNAAGAGEAMLTPEDKAEANEVALGCTQGMLMALDRDERLAYVLGVVFGLSSEEAAAVMEIAPAAHRKRLSRARERLHGFMQGACGLVSEDAACRCHRQLPARRALRGGGPAVATEDIAFTGMAEVNRPGPSSAERPSAAESAARYEELRTMFDAASVFRAHPTYAAPAALVDAIRGMLRTSGWMASG